MPTKKKTTKVKKTSKKTPKKTVRKIVKKIIKKVVKKPIQMIEPEILQSIGHDETSVTVVTSKKTYKYKIGAHGSSRFITPA